MSEARTMSAPGPAPFNTKTLYSLMDTSLSQFTRAQQVAQAYQHYRIKYIQLKIRSSFLILTLLILLRPLANLIYIT